MKVRSFHYSVCVSGISNGSQGKQQVLQMERTRERGGENTGEQSHGSERNVV